MKDDSKGTYKLKTKNDNFPDGKIEYDFNNINGFSSMKASQYLQKQGYMTVMPANDNQFNACLFALASGQDMGAIMSLGMADFNMIATKTMYFFAVGLDSELESSTKAENTEN